MKNLKNIIPYEGLDFLKLYSDINDIRNILNIQSVQYSEEIFDNSDCDIKYNWIVITIDESIKLFFSEGNSKLFKIYVSNGSLATLPNGIKLGMSIEEAQKIDNSLTYDEWEEIYLSNSGYYLEDDPETDNVYSITIHVKEFDNEDFLLCNW